MVLMRGQRIEYSCSHTTSFRKHIYIFYTAKPKQIFILVSSFSISKYKLIIPQIKIRTKSLYSQVSKPFYIEIVAKQFVIMI